LPWIPHFKACTRDGDSSCLSSLILRRYRRWIGGSPRSLALPVASPDVAAGCPALHILGFYRRSISKLPWISNPFGATSGFQVLGSPATLFRPSRLSMHRGFPHFCIFRSCRRSIIELPRLSYPSAPLLRQPQVSPLPRFSSCACRYRYQVAPVPASSGFAGNGSSSYPESLVLRHLRCLSSRFPLNSALSAAPADDAVSFPTSLIFRLRLRFELRVAPVSLPWRRLMDYRVSSALAPSGSAVPASSGCPESCIYGWVDDVSRSSRTLHPRLSPRMNLRIQSGYAVLCPDSGCITSISFMLSTYRRTGL
jgi:hypothetical protein